MKTVLRFAAIAILACCGSGHADAGCEGCDLDDIVAPYTQRIDRMTTSSGNAKAVNTVTHMITPWPPYVFNRRIPVNGKRLVDAITNYQDKLKPESATGAPAAGKTPTVAGTAAGMGAGMGAGLGTGGGQAAGGYDQQSESGQGQQSGQ